MGIEAGLIVAANSVTLLAGGVVTALAFRAYQRTASPALGALTLGFTFVTCGALVGGFMHQLWSVSLLSGVAIQSVFTAIGLLFLVFSLHTTHAGDHAFAESQVPRT